MPVHHDRVRAPGDPRLLRDRGRAAGLTGQDVAAALGLHFTGISRIENGVKPPTERNIRDWCAACGAQEQIADLITTALAVESSYLEWTRQSRAGMRRLGDQHSNVGIIPADAQRYAIASVGFWIFDDNAVALETPTAAIKVTRPQEIARYAALFARLQAEAAYAAQARAARSGSTGSRASPG